MQPDGDRFDKINPVSFSYIPHRDLDTPNKKQYCMLAEELVHIYPEAINHHKDGTISGIQYDKFTAILIKEVQHLRARMLALEAGSKK